MNTTRISTAITTLSALVLALGGTALLFASDVLLSGWAPGAAATVLGQLVGAGWLALAWLNWVQRRAVIGGIYARPMVVANLALYLISGLSLVRGAMASDAPSGMLLLALVFGLLGVIYAVLLMRGPLGSDSPTATRASAP